MTIKSGVSVDPVLVPSVVAAILTPPLNTRVTINSATFYANAAATLILHIVPSGGSASNTNKVLDKALALDESFTAPELIGQSIEVGGTLQASDDGGTGTAISSVITTTEFSGDS